MIRGYENQVDEIKAIKLEMEALEFKKKSLEAELLVDAQEQMNDSKITNIVYAGSYGNTVTVTKTSTLKLLDQAKLKSLLDKDTYKLNVTESKQYKLSTPLSKMLKGIVSNEYMNITVKEVVSNLDIDDSRKAMLLSKLKGDSFDKDVKVIQSIVGVDVDEAMQIAFFVQEAYTYEQLVKIFSVEDSQVKELVEELSKTVSVTNGTKITVG